MSGLCLDDKGNIYGTNRSIEKIDGNVVYKMKSCEFEGWSLEKNVFLSSGFNHVVAWNTKTFEYYVQGSMDVALVNNEEDAELREESRSAYGFSYRKDGAPKCYVFGDRIFKETVICGRKKPLRVACGMDCMVLY